MPPRVKFRGGKLGKVLSLTGIDRGHGGRASTGGEEAEPADALHFHILGDAVIVVAANGVVGVFLHPLDTGTGLGAVIDEVAQEEADIVRLLDGLEGRPIPMDVGDEQYAHEPSLTRF